MNHKRFVRINRRTIASNEAYITKQQVGRLKALYS